LQWLRLGVVAALTLFFCSFARSCLYTVVVATMALRACQLQGLARESFARLGSAEWARTLTDVLGRVIPDLQLFDLGVPLALQADFGGAGAAALSALGYGLLYLPVVLLLSVWVFADREL
jgi:predicted permease